MKRLVVLSGGMDSLVALASQIDQGNEVEAVHFQYGSKHNYQELQAVGWIGKHYGIKIHGIDLPFMGQHFKSDLLLRGGSIPDGHYEDENMKKTVIPFRNGIMLSVAAGLAESIEADAVVLGNHAGDHAIYPDCRADFIGAMRESIFRGTYRGILLESPFVGLLKAEIVKLGSILKVPFELSWSCYKGNQIHCGTCGTCVERREAFELAGVPDSTEYEYTGPLPEKQR